jgi:hypothetical protein
MQAPLFILGLQRSGTTLLYEMLAASGCFRISTSWHVICFDDLLRDDVDVSSSRRQLADRFAAAGLKTRGMDAVAAGPDMPEEYGFVLANRGLGMQIEPRSLPVFQDFCRVLHRCDHSCSQAADSLQDKPLLLKNTWDFGNADRIRQLVPGARFVFIHRNPFQIVSSLSRVVRTAVLKGFPYLEMISDRYRSFARGGLRLRLARLACGRAPGLVAHSVIRFVAHQARGYLRTAPSLSPDERMDIRYETLCERPNETMAALLRFALGDRFDAAGIGRDYRPMIGPHATHVEPEIIARRRLVIRCLAPYATAVGYDLTELGERIAPGGSQ